MRLLTSPKVIMIQWWLSQHETKHQISHSGISLWVEFEYHLSSVLLGGGDTSAYNDRVRKISNELNKLTVIVSLWLLLTHHWVGDGLMVTNLRAMPLAPYN